MEYSVIGEVVPREKGVKVAEGKEVILSEIYQDKLNKILSIEKQEG